MCNLLLILCTFFALRERKRRDFEMRERDKERLIEITLPITWHWNSSPLRNDARGPRRLSTDLNTALSANDSRANDESAHACTLAPRDYFA